jgi:hypothetical protein
MRAYLWTQFQTITFKTVYRPIPRELKRRYPVEHIDLLTHLGRKRPIGRSGSHNRYGLTIQISDARGTSYLNTLLAARTIGNFSLGIDTHD